MFNGNSYVEFATVEVNKIIDNINPTVDITTFVIDLSGEYVSATFHALPGLSQMIESISAHAMINESPIDHTTSHYTVAISNL